MEGVVINIMSKAKKTKAISNLSAHNKQAGKATGNRDDNYKKYNFDVLEMQGEKSIDNYNKYFKEHAHTGYNAHKEEFGEGDFVVPRLNDTITKVESIIVAPPAKILIKDIDKFDFTEAQCFFDDYIHNFIKQDSKFKDVKVLSAKVHCNEVYYPRYEEIDGTTKLRRLSREESIDRAYVKVHMHMDYIPLIEAEKNGKKFLKLSSNDLWKSERGRYFDSFREFNDRFYEAVGKHYSLSRGQKWEEWDVRVQKKNNGELVKENTRLSDWQLNHDEELNKKYKKQLEEEIKTAGEEAKKQLQEEIAQLEAESFDEFERNQREYAKQLKQMEEQKNKIEHDLKNISDEKADAQRMLSDIQMQADSEYKDYIKMHDDIEKAIEELTATEAEIEKRQNINSQIFKELEADRKVLANIERRLKRNEITMQEANKVIDDYSLDDKIKLFKEESAKEHTLNLHNLANSRDER